MKPGKMETPYLALQKPETEKFQNKNIQNISK